MSDKLRICCKNMSENLRICRNDGVLVKLMLSETLV
jgi:hypothetical protein